MKFRYPPLVYSLYLITPLSVRSLITTITTNIVLRYLVSKYEFAKSKNLTFLYASIIIYGRINIIIKSRSPFISIEKGKLFV